MKIVVLDGYTLNPGDLSWDQMKKLGEVHVFDRTSKTDILERCEGAEIVLTNKVILDRQTFQQLPELKYIGVLATGYNIVDVEAASDRGIIVTNIPAYSTHSVAELTFGLILEISLDLSSHLQSVRNGEWANHKDFSYTTRTTHELAGKKLGIVGYGRIAKQVIKMAKAFAMNVSVLTSHPDDEDGVNFVNKEELFSDSDIITLHTSLRPDNEKIVCQETLDLMKPTACLVNTSRGGLINEQDLAKSLNDERIAAAALDVLSLEPPVNGNPLLKAKNCLITPHIAWSTYEARSRLMDMAISNIKSFIDGTPVNVVN